MKKTLKHALISLGVVLLAQGAAAGGDAAAGEAKSATCVACHGPDGNSPAPSGPFVEGRTATTLGLRADYLSRWQADLSYTRMGGEGNDLADRDFVSLSVKYSF